MSLGRAALALLLYLAFQLSTPLALASEDAQVTLKLPNGNSAIDGLTFKADELNPNVLGRGKEAKVEVSIQGTYSKSEWNFFRGTKQVATDANGEFKINLTMTKATKKVKFVAVGPKGENQTISVVLEVANWKELAYVEPPESKRTPPVAEASTSAEGAETEKKGKSHFFSAGLGTSFIGYQDSRISRYSETALTLKGSYRWEFIKRWSASLGGYYTLLPFTKTSPDAFRFLGINFRVGYNYKIPTTSWSVGINGGGYYTTMFVPSSGYGFKNMSGPQLFPTLQKSFKKLGTAAAYFKLSPIFSGASLLSFANREIAGGVSYAYPLANGHTVSAGIDIATIRLTITSVEINSSSVSTGISYNF